MKASPEAEARINQISQRNKGRISAIDIINDARKKNSPLHKYFDWDLERAAMQQWHEVANRLIRSIKIDIQITQTEIKGVGYKKSDGPVADTRPMTSVGYVRDPDCIQTKTPGFIAIELAAESKQDMNTIMEHEISALIGHIKRAISIAEVFGMADEVKQSLAVILKLQEKIVQIRDALPREGIEQTSPQRKKAA